MPEQTTALVFYVNRFITHHMGPAWMPTESALHAQDRLAVVAGVCRAGQSWSGPLAVAGVSALSLGLGVRCLQAQRRLKPAILLRSGG